MVRIAFQRGKCIGCNGCVEAAPDRWRVSKSDGRCNLVGSKQKKGFFHVVIDEDEYPQNLLASKNCPVKIIKIEKF